MRSSRLLFKGREDWVVRIFGIDPGHAAANLLGVGVDSVAANAGDGTAVTVAGLRGYLGGLTEAHVGEGLLRPGSEGLGLLGRVDFGESDLHLLLIVHDGQRVAVTDRDDDCDEQRD